MSSWSRKSYYTSSITQEKIVYNVVVSHSQAFSSTRDVHLKSRIQEHVSRPRWMIDE